MSEVMRLDGAFTFFHAESANGSHTINPHEKQNENKAQAALGCSSRPCPTDKQITK